MIREIKNIEDALELFENAAINNITGRSDYKKVNKAYVIMEKAIVYLLENNSIEELRKFYDKDNVYAKLSAAFFLAPIDGEEAKRIVSEIVDTGEEWVSFNAEMGLKNWENLSDSLFYSELLEKYNKKKE